MSRWRRFPGERFPRTSGPEKAEPLEPRALGRRLLRAARRDARRAWRGGAAAERPSYSAELVAELPPETRRAVALRLQRERRGMRARDKEWWTVTALTGAPCGWGPEDAGVLFDLAFDGLDRRRPAPRAPLSASCLLLPLAALEELPPHERAARAGDLTTALVAVLGCHSSFRGFRGAAGDPGSAEDQAMVRRLHGLLGLDHAVEVRLLPDGAYGAAARCGLGAWLYDPDVRDLLAQCREVDGVRPPYAWLGRMRERLPFAPRARQALAPLLAAARGGSEDCAYRSGHEDMLTPEAARLLAGLAWAACVSDEEEPVRQLGLALTAVNAGRWNDGPSLFLRAGIAALTALSGEPGVGNNHRVLAGASPQAVRAAEEALSAMRAGNPWSDPSGLRMNLGDCTATFLIGTDGGVELDFRNRRGQRLVRVPERVRVDHPVEYLQLRARLTELRARVERHRGALAERPHADAGQPAGQWCATLLEDRAFEPLARALLWEADTERGPVAGPPVRPPSP